MYYKMHIFKNVDNFEIEHKGVGAEDTVPLKEILFIGLYVFIPLTSFIKVLYLGRPTWK